MLRLSIPLLLLGSLSAQMREHIERFVADRQALETGYFGMLPKGRMADLFADASARLEAVDFTALDQANKVDWLLLRNHILAERARLARAEKAKAEIAGFLPFAETIETLAAMSRRGTRPGPEAAAETLVALSAEIGRAKKELEVATPAPHLAARGARYAETLLAALRRWHSFSASYDPDFTWWTGEPFPTCEKALAEHVALLRSKGAGPAGGPEAPITGDPIGREGILEELAFEWIPYTPEELINLAEKELAWCEGEMKKAASEVRCGDDWKKALDYVKRHHVPAGGQPTKIVELATEIVAYLEVKDLVTIPPLCKETWRMEMMSPARQLVNPFFLGGDTITVSYPTDTMTHADKLMSMRGNNVHFARATVHHELIPGHHLQGFVAAREKPYRRLFETPFYVEGWALYWEMRLWDMGFGATPEDRLGMLFWRAHRCARIVFSLSFHLGKMTPQQAIDLLVDKVGHERANATAEVRRSFGGDYPPLYQAAYMLGGMQLRALQKELVGTGKLTDKAFHDAVLKENAIPIEFVRAALTGQSLARDQKSTWRPW